MHIFVSLLHFCSLSYILKITVVVFWTFSLLYGYTLDPITETDRQVDAYFFEAIDKVKELDYTGGLELMHKIIELVPDHPAGYLFTSAILSWIISDFYRFDYSERFLKKIDETIEVAKDMIRRDRNNPWGYVYLGGAYGFRGIYYSETGSFYYAFLDGVRGNYKLNKAISLDPRIYDNYFGTGTFDFWKAYYSGKFFWLGTSEKNKQVGIDKINLAIEKGKYTVLEAEFSLIRVYLVDGRYQDAINQAKKILKYSPNSIKVRRFIGITYREKGDHQKALDAFLKERDIIESHPLRNSEILLQVNINIAKSYRDLDQITNAQSLFKNMRSYYDDIIPENNFLENLMEEYENLEREINDKVALND